MSTCTVYRYTFVWVIPSAVSSLFYLSHSLPAARSDQPSPKPGHSLQEPSKRTGRERRPAHEGKEASSKRGNWPHSSPEFNESIPVIRHTDEKLSDGSWVAVFCGILIQTSHSMICNCMYTLCWLSRLTCIAREYVVGLKWLVKIHGFAFICMVLPCRSIATICMWKFDVLCCVFFLPL